jgi:hypothetical protein
MVRLTRAWSSSLAGRRGAVGRRTASLAAPDRPREDADDAHSHFFRLKMSQRTKPATTMSPRAHG